MTVEENEGFLGRWSRLKQQQDELPESQPALAPADINQVAAESVEADLQTETELDSNNEVAELAEPLTDADMPNIESLDEQSDYTGFLSEGVSDALKRKAMRKLFHLPEFNIRDGLNDYDDDFSTFIPLGDTVTYQMKQWLEQEAKAKEKLTEGDGSQETECLPSDVALSADSDPKEGFSGGANEGIQSDGNEITNEGCDEDFDGELDDEMEGEVG